MSANESTLADAYAQLDAFAAAYKAPKSDRRKTWREAINFDYWMKGAAVPGFPLIYGLRNQPGHGPQWLATYQPGQWERDDSKGLYVLKNRQIGHGPAWEYLTLNWAGETLGTFEMHPNTAAREFSGLESIAPARLLALWSNAREARQV